MNNVYLILGSNLGNRYRILEDTSTAIAQDVGVIIDRSSIYETAPWGIAEQPEYLNQVLQVESSLTPQLLLDKLQDIEKQLHRKRYEKWGARTIDIDILFYNDAHIQTSELTIPHPHLHKRNFTLYPLAEIAPDLIHPALRKSIKQLLKESPDTLEVHVYDPAENLNSH